jgi:ferredoxin-fold anticodon binding domain-containing protein
MIGPLPSESNVPKDYAAVKQLAKDKITALVGKEITVTSRHSGTVIWKVVAAVESDDAIPERSAGKKCRFTRFDIGSHKKVEDLLRYFYPFPF